MTRAGRWLVRQLERLLGRYYEGPTPPRRLAEEARLFRVMYPCAGPDEWEAFAARLAASSYRDGFVRGFEWNERDWSGPADDPERLAEATAHDWSLAEADPRLENVLLLGTDPGDPLAALPPLEREQYYQRMGAVLRQNVVMVEVGDDD